MHKSVWLITKWTIHLCCNLQPKANQACDFVRKAIAIRYGGVYLDQDVLTLRPFFSPSSYRLYDDADLGEYTGIVAGDVITRAALVAQKRECRKLPNCVNNAVMIFPKGDPFIRDAMVDTVKRQQLSNKHLLSSQNSYS